MKYVIVVLFIVIIIQDFLLGRSTTRLNESTISLMKSTALISDQQRQIEDLYSINRVQESWLRSCGFYGKEE
ncbi:hypothetical protein UFOVP53_170 [uncultured Caudovirales phage]|uniref:Uncharacterized protein n=1 Tax=uncultured Caudovirales phage TaxID=2100421 RepID=A0A6J5KWW9_9CAUD|nr:hypothetical protein UFOVP53_170 [uncultured Caudovirales phage]